MNQDFPYIAGFGLALAGAVGAMTYMLSGGLEITLASGVTLALLGLGQMSLLGLVLRRSSGQNVGLNKIMREMGSLRSDVKHLMSTTVERFTQVEQGNSARNAQIESGLTDLQKTFATLQKNVKSLAQIKVQPDKKLNVEPKLEPRLDAIKQQQPDKDQVEFALEPVIDLVQQTTAHYRLHATMTMNGTQLKEADFLQLIEQTGKRAILDVSALEQALGLLKRLRARDPGLCIVVNVGAEFLRNENAITQTLHNCVLAKEATSGLVLEISQRILADLGTVGLEGLAQCARAGLGFALCDVEPAGLDIQAMKMLKIRFVRVGVDELSNNKNTANFAAFAIAAQKTNVQIIVTEINDAGQIALAANCTHLACGTCFAPPRQVKRMSLYEAASPPSLRLVA